MHDNAGYGLHTSLNVRPCAGECTESAHVQYVLVVERVAETKIYNENGTHYLVTLQRLVTYQIIHETQADLFLCKLLIKTFSVIVALN